MDLALERVVELLGQQRQQGDLAFLLLLLLVVVRVFDVPLDARAEALRNPPVLEVPPQEPELPRRVGPQLAELGHRAAHAAHELRKHGQSKQHHHDGEQALQNVVRHDVYAAYAELGERPVEGCHVVQHGRPAIVVGRDPVRATVDHVPQASEAVPAAGDYVVEDQHAQERLRDAEVYRHLLGAEQVLDDLREAVQLRQAHQPDEARYPDGPHQPDDAPGAGLRRARLERHDGPVGPHHQRVDREPRPGVVDRDEPGGHDQVAQVEVAHEQRGGDVEAPEQPDEPVHRLEEGERGGPEGAQRHHDDVVQQGAETQHLPGEAAPRVRVLDPAALEARRPAPRLGARAPNGRPGAAPAEAPRGARHLAPDVGGHALALAAGPRPDRPQGVDAGDRERPARPGPAHPHRGRGPPVLGVVVAAAHFHVARARVLERAVVAQLLPLVRDRHVLAVVRGHAPVGAGRAGGAGAAAGEDLPATARLWPCRSCAHLLQRRAC
mmetsp:Transcript_14389/g.41004  ORF Transcript_14389/g.41004 Transcript_14389/m.41004 type:complete len:494 (+) Transcript_14389:709-2190(+)